MSCHQHVYEKIKENRKRIQDADQQDKTYPEHGRPIVPIEILRKPLPCFYMVLEPHIIADEMFQEDDISVDEHDAVTESNKKYKRVKELIKVLEERPKLLFYISKYITDHGKERKLTDQHSECALCIQQNFILLQKELFYNEVGITYMDYLDYLYEFLDEIDQSDIDYQFSSEGKIRKLLKILMVKGEEPCRKLFKVIEEDLKRDDLVKKMRKKSKHLQERGKLLLENELRHLNCSCLEEHRKILRNELDPLRLCDLLFEERAVDFPDHDKVTEAKRHGKQIDYLLDIVSENKNDCFSVFLCILQIEGYKDILKELK